MSDVVFRKKEEVKDEPVKNQNIVEKEVATDIVKEPVPYTEYQAENGKPYLADLYSLGDSWEVFNEELRTIQHYIERKMDSGEIANSTKAVTEVIKKMEKLHNLKDEERTVVRLGTLASYIRFLNETEGIKFNWRKYND